MSCKYCRGEKPLFDNMDEDGGWCGTMNPFDGTMTARFEAGELYNHACGELELDWGYCPMCGAEVTDVMNEVFNG